PARRSNTLRQPVSPVSAHDTAAATRYKGTITTPPQQAYWVACRASCRNSAEEESSPSSRVTMTLPRQNAGAGGTGSRYPVPTNSRSALRATRAPPRAATPSPASVDPLARLIHARRPACIAAAQDPSAGVCPFRPGGGASGPPPPPPRAGAGGGSSATTTSAHDGTDAGAGTGFGSFICSWLWSWCARAADRWECLRLSRKLWSP